MYTAKSASDKTDEWPYWYVEFNRANVIPSKYREETGKWLTTLPFVTRTSAENIATKLNKGEKCGFY